MSKNKLIARSLALHRMLAIVLCLPLLTATAQKPKSTDVRLEIQPDSTGKALVTWSITNDTKLAVYVYDFFLWGPAEWDEEKGGVTILGTEPSREEAGCPPNRVAPVLLLVIAPGRTIHGDFIDDRLKLAPQAKVAMRIAIFNDPYKVVEEWKRFYNTAANTAITTPSSVREQSSKATLFSCRRQDS